MIIGALDIGSNSIHLVVVETEGQGSFRVLASGKEMVRLGRSVARDRRLSEAAMSRAVGAIEKFTDIARKHKATELIAVATSATRDADNRAEFLERVAEKTDVHIDLLSGIEEARLIALATWAKVKPRARVRLLAIDIGGGSTEVSITQGGEPAVLISFKLGAVRMTEYFVTSDPISDKQLKRLRDELREILVNRAPEIKKVGFDTAYGTSGTILSLATILWHRHHKGAKEGPSPEGLTIRLSDLQELNVELAGLDLDERAKLPGLSRARAEIIIAGGQLLEALMETLGIEELNTCDWALREGVILAYLARHASTDSATVTKLERDPSLRGALTLLDHYQSDRKHAVKVATLAQQLFAALRPLHLLGGEHQRLLAAAAILHDIGYFVSHTNHNKHSAYLIQNSELTGFMASEIALIANVARYHRSSTPKTRHPYYSALPVPEQETVRKLAAILRIADALDRDHAGRIKSVSCRYDDDTIYLTAHSTRASEATQYRIEERADLLREVFARQVELAIELAT